MAGSLTSAGGSKFKEYKPASSAMLITLGPSDGISQVPGLGVVGGKLTSMFKGRSSIVVECQSLKGAGKKLHVEDQWKLLNRKSLYAKETTI